MPAIIFYTRGIITGQDKSPVLKPVRFLPLNKTECYVFVLVATCFVLL